MAGCSRCAPLPVGGAAALGRRPRSVRPSHRQRSAAGAPCYFETNSLRSLVHSETRRLTLRTGPPAGRGRGGSAPASRNSPSLPTSTLLLFFNRYHNRHINLLSLSSVVVASFSSSSSSIPFTPPFPLLSFCLPATTPAGFFCLFPSFSSSSFSYAVIGGTRPFTTQPGPNDDTPPSRLLVP